MIKVMNEYPSLDSLSSEAVPPAKPHHRMDAEACAGVGALLSLGSYALHCGAANGGTFAHALYIMSGLARGAGIISWGVGLAKAVEPMGATIINAIKHPDNRDPTRDPDPVHREIVKAAPMAMGASIIGLLSMQLGEMGVKYANTIASHPHAPLLRIASGTLMGVGLVAGGVGGVTILNATRKGVSELFSSKPATTLDTTPDAQHQGQVAEVQREYALT
jgi:hypothetical protein